MVAGHWITVVPNQLGGSSEDGNVHSSEVIHVDVGKGMNDFQKLSIDQNIGA